MNPSPLRGRPPLYPARHEKGPCMDCADRSPGCHDRCQAYQAFKKRSEARKAAERKCKEDATAVNAFKAAQCLKIAHRKPHER